MNFKETHKKITKDADEFFNYLGKGIKFNDKKALNFGKPKKVKKSFSSEGFRF